MKKWIGALQRKCIINDLLCWNQKNTMWIHGRIKTKFKKKSSLAVNGHVLDSTCLKSFIMLNLFLPRLPEDACSVPILRMLPSNSTTLDMGAFLTSTSPTLFDSLDHQLQDSPHHGSCLTPSQLFTPASSPQPRRPPSSSSPCSSSSQPRRPPASPSPCSQLRVRRVQQNFNVV